MRQPRRPRLLKRPRPRGARNALAALLAGFLALLPAALGAHPHSFIDARLGIVIADTRVVAVEVTWLFDDADTEIAVDNTDEDGDGKLGEGELRGLAERMARTSGQFGFHVHLFVGEKPMKTVPVGDFRLGMRDNRLEARFRMSLAEPIDLRSRRPAIGLYDETYWIQFSLDPARDIAATLPEGCRLETFKDRRIVIYEVVGQKVHPTVTEIHCGK